MATKKAETQNNENIANNEEIKKEENIEVEKKNIKSKTKATTGTTRKAATTTKKSTSKKTTEKVSASKKNEDKNNKEEKMKTSKKDESKTDKEAGIKKATVNKNTKKENEENKSDQKEIKEKVETSKKTVKKDDKKVIKREEKLKELAQKVNQFAKDEEEELEEKENIEVVPQEKIVKIEEIKKTIKNKKELPKEEVQKINKMLFRNIMVAIGIIVYFIFLNLGKMNIENSVYVTDLKVFSMCTLLAAIILIEVSYKKDSGETALYGVEMIVLAITTIALIYVNLMLSSRYVYIVTAISFIFAIYYLIKSMVIYLKKRKQYFVNDMKEIMNKEEVE